MYPYTNEQNWAEFHAEENDAGLERALTPEPSEYLALDTEERPNEANLFSGIDASRVSLSPEPEPLVGSLSGGNDLQSSLLNGPMPAGLEGFGEPSVSVPAFPSQPSSMYDPSAWPGVAAVTPMPMLANPSGFLPKSNPLMSGMGETWSAPMTMAPNMIGGAMNSLSSFPAGMASCQSCGFHNRLNLTPPMPMTYCSAVQCHHTPNEYELAYACACANGQGPNQPLIQGQQSQQLAAPMLRQMVRCDGGPAFPMEGIVAQNQCQFHF